MDGSIRTIAEWDKNDLVPIRPRLLGNGNRFLLTAVLSSILYLAFGISFWSIPFVSLAVALIDATYPKGLKSLAATTPLALFNDDCEVSVHINGPDGELGSDRGTLTIDGHWLSFHGYRTAFSFRNADVKGGLLRTRYEVDGVEYELNIESSSYQWQRKQIARWLEAAESSSNEIVHVTLPPTARNPGLVRAAWPPFLLGVALTLTAICLLWLDGDRTPAMLFFFAFSLGEVIKNLVIEFRYGLLAEWRTQRRALNPKRVAELAAEAPGREMDR